MKLILPWPPSANRIWRNVVVAGKPRTLLSKEGREYRHLVGVYLAKFGGVNKGLKGRIAVSIIAEPPDRRRRDLDNINKALLDALTHNGVWLDDSQIDRLVVQRAAPRKGGNITMEIKELVGEEY
jgi:crossover junction endodeoxyribonuclease RusA